MELQELLAELDAALEGGSTESSTLWEQALTHSSYAYEHGLPKGSENERLEFLGDAVIDLAVSRYLYENFPDRPRGSSRG